MSKCDQCGTELLVSGRGQPARWCSQKCRHAYRRDRERASLLATMGDRLCAFCETPLSASMRLDAECCSQQCRIALNARKRSERRLEKAQSRMRSCPACEAVVDATANHRRKYCSPECKKREMDARWRAKSAAGYLRKYHYNLSEEHYAALLAAQGAVCAICGTSEWAGNTGKPNVDHDHGCNHPGKGVQSCAACVRGLLCDFCNRGLGMFRDDPARLRAAVDYLERYSCGTLFSIAG